MIFSESAFYKQVKSCGLVILQNRSPYHICVCLYGVLHDRASVPATVQPDQGPTAVVACEFAICEWRQQIKINETKQSHTN